MSYELDKSVGLHVFIFIHPVQGCKGMNFPGSAQGLTISIKLWYMIKYVCQNFGVCDIHGQIPKKHISSTIPFI